MNVHDLARRCSMGSDQRYFVPDAHLFQFANLILEEVIELTDDMSMHSWVYISEKLRDMQTKLNRNGGQGCL